jgi:hypothetical protein
VRIARRLAVAVDRSDPNSRTNENLDLCLLKTPKAAKSLEF